MIPLLWKPRRPPARRPLKQQPHCVGPDRKRLLWAEGAEAEEAFVAGEVDFDFDRLSVVGEGHQKIRRALQLQSDHGCFLN